MATAVLLSQQIFSAFALNAQRWRRHYTGRMDTPVKLTCSLRWLCGVLANTPLLQGTSGQTLSKLLLEPYKHDNLNRELVQCLTIPRLYMGAYNVIYPNERLEGNSFEPLFHALAKRGGYVLEDDHNIVTDPMLVQSEPFRPKSHLALLDTLMSQYSSKLIKVQRIVRAVRQISTFNPSKELPSKVEVDLLLTLWLNKVCEAVFAGQQQQEGGRKSPRSPDPKQRKRLRSSGGDGAVPHIEKDLFAGIRDGRCFAALLLHYVPQDCKKEDFELGFPLKKKQIMKNLQFVYEYCLTHIPTPSFHINPYVLMEWGQANILTANILALLSHLFYHFELKGHDASVKKSSNVAQSAVSKTPPPSAQSLQSSSEGAISRPPLSTPESSVPSLRPNLQSRSSGNLPSSRQGVKTSSLVRSSRAPNKTGAVAEGVGIADSESPSNFRVFQAPFRSSLNANQSKALASFSTAKSSLLKGTHAQSTPVLHNPSNSSGSGSGLISLSSENLNTQDQVRVSNRESLVRQNHARKSKRSDVQSHRYVSDEGSFTPEFRISLTDSRKMHFKELDLIAISTDGEDSKILDNVGNAPASTTEPEPRVTSAPSDVRGSFTLDKQHTYASASEAGLPIINGQDQQFSDKVVAIKSELGRDESKIPGCEVLTPPQVLVPPTLDMTIQAEPASASVQELRSNVRAFVSTLVAENANFEMKVRSQRLKLYHLAKAKGIDSTLDSEESIASSESASETFVTATSEQKHPDTAESASGVIISERKHPDTAEPAGSVVTSEYKHPDTVEYATGVITSKHKHPDTAEPAGGVITSKHKHPDTAELAGGVITSKHKHPDTAEPARGVITSKHKHPDTAEPAGGVITSKQKPSVSRGASLASTTVPTFKVEVTPSLERFQQDEAMILMQVSSEDGVPDEHNTRPMSVKSEQHSLHSFPFTPVASTGQVYIAKSPSVHSTDVQPPQAGVVKEMEVANPWSKPPNKDSKLADNMKKKEEELRIKMEERNLARKKLAEQRKLSGKSETQDKQQKGKRHTDVVSQHMHGLEAIPNTTEHRAATIKGSTIHFQLSTHEPLQAPAPQEQADTNAQAQPSADLGVVCSYNGPGCYIKPKAKSNLQIIRNAICTVCLAGDVNMSLKQKILVEMDKSSATHVMVLFRDTIGFKFRGIYSYNPGDRCVLKIYGSGPKEIKESMISHLYKYNSGQKEFKEIPSRSLSVTVDGVTIKSEYWHTTKRKN